MTKICLSDSEFATHGDVSSVPEVEEIHQRLPQNSSFEIEVKKVKNAVFCELRCFSEWGKFVASRTDSTLQKALGAAGRSVLKSIDAIRNTAVTKI